MFYCPQINRVEETQVKDPSSCDFGMVTSWTQMIRTDLRDTDVAQPDLLERDEPIWLEVVIHCPQGSGPFPLAVINHGSTGDGKDPSFFGETWSHTSLAALLVR